MFETFHNPKGICPYGLLSKNLFLCLRICTCVNQNVIVLDDLCIGLRFCKDFKEYGAIALYT